MASRKILVQLDIAAASNLTSPLSGFVGFSAKADGLYQKIGTAPELRLLTSADVQNAILADGSITGAVSQAQIFTIGVKLYNLTQGYIPYASGATKLLSNSPIYTDGTNVGIGTAPGYPLHINQGSAAYGINLQSPSTNPFGAQIRFLSNVGVTPKTGLFQLDNSGNMVFRTAQSGMYFDNMGTGSTYFRTGGTNVRMLIDNTGNLNINSGQLYVQQSTGNIGIGTPAPNQQLEITKNFRLPSTAGTTPYGIIYKDGNRFIHDFNYGNNGTVTTSGGNTFVGINAGNFTMGSTATSAGNASYNTGIGYQSLYANTTGNSNTANGYQSLRSNTTGSSNSAFGHQSLFSNTTGSNNVAIGYNSLIFNTTGYYNTALGVNSLFANTTGNNNTAFGHQSLIANITGSSNSVLGYNAGRYIANGTTGRTTGNNGLYLGTHTKASADGTDNEIVIGYNAIGAGSNKTVIGNSSVTDTYFGSSTGSSKLWASALNLSSLTASKVVFTDSSKNLTSTGIGTAYQFIKGDGSLDSNTYITASSISGFVPYTGANDNVNLGTHNLSCNEISTASKLIVGKPNTGYSDGGLFRIISPGTNYSQFYFYSIDTLDEFGVVEITANPEEGIMLSARSNDNSMNSSLRIGAWDLGLYTNSLKRLEIAQNGSINAFGNTITSTGGFIGNASTATKLQTARTITIGNQSLPFDGTENITYTLSGIGIPVGTASQYFRGDLSLATFPTIHTGSGVDGGVTFWNGTNSLSSSANLTWDNTNSRLSVNSISLASSFKLGSSTTAGYVLTTDANGNGTWQAPQGGGNIVSSVFGRTGTVVAVNGDYNTSQVTENTNLYFTDSRARVAISLTINGQSGASTYNNSTGILNVPNYSLTGLGGVPKTRTITINGEVQDLSANRTWNVGDLLSTGSYSNPSWLTSLAWSKITNKPTTFYGYGITETPWTSYLPLSGGTLTGDLNSKRIICQSIIGDDYNTGAIEIWGSRDNTFYPTLGFHQPSKFAASIQLRGAIDFRLYAQGGTTYANLTTNKLISASLQIGTSTTSGYVLTADANGNGTWQAPTGASYTLPTATASVLGGVKIGSGITISSGVISVSTNYQAPITTGTTAQYFRGDLSLATFPTIHTGNGFNGGVTFWNGANSLSAAGELTWNNISKNLVVTGGLTVNDISSNSMSTNSLSTNGFRLIATTTAGYVLTTDANGNGTWQAPTSGGSYTLPTATASVLGGVKIGSGITISSGVISVSTNYEAPLTFTNGLSRTGNMVSFSVSLSGFVPYEGATQNVNLGSKRLTADNICVTTGSGAGKFLMDVTGQGHAAWSNIPVASSTVTGSIKVGYGLQIDQAVLSVNPSAFVPYTGADRDVNLASYSIYAYDFLIYSDINLKCNIEDIEMKKLDINYKQFEYKTSRGEKRYGVIAQELLSIAPEFVSESNNSYAVKYTDLLIYEVAQLKEEVKQLKSLVCR